MFCLSSSSSSHLCRPCCLYVVVLKVIMQWLPRGYHSSQWIQSKSEREFGFLDVPPWHSNNTLFSFFFGLTDHLRKLCFAFQTPQFVLSISFEWMRVVTDHSEHWTLIICILEIAVAVLLQRHSTNYIVYEHRLGLCRSYFCNWKMNIFQATKWN